MPSGVLLEGPDPSQGPVRNRWQSRDTATPTPVTRGVPDREGSPLEASTPRATRMPVHPGMQGAQNQAALTQGPPGSREQLQDQEPSVLVVHKVPNLPPWMESCPCCGLQPLPGLR